MPDQPEAARRFSSSFHFDWIAVVLAILIVFCASASIAMAEWVPNLDALSLTVVVSGSLGALIASSRWRPRTAHVIMLLYGMVVGHFVVHQ